MTGNVLGEDKAAMIKAGANKVMEKPFDVDRFSAWYASYLEVRGKAEGD